MTTTLELATSIVISTQRQTVLLAKQAAELDLLTGGRLRLGVGIGRNWMEYEALEQDFSNRGRRIEEQVAVMRQLWTNELVTFDGHWHHLDRIGVNPLPVQRPIPIWMGSFVGNIVEKVLERTGRLADGWMPQFPPGEQLAAALERLRGYASGRRPRPEHIGHRVRNAHRSGRRSADVGRHRDRLSSARRDAPARVDSGRRLLHACRAPRRVDPMARHRRSGRPRTEEST